MEVEKVESPLKERIADAYGKKILYGDASRYGKKKYFFPSNYSSISEQIRNVHIRENDIFIGGFSRSGTHWLAELTWLISNDLNFEQALSLLHEERIYYFDFNPKAVEVGHSIAFDRLPSPRFFKTHLPLSHLPPNLLDTAKMVYVVRDPRDVVVSCYYFYKSHSYMNFRKDLKEFWYLFRTDNCVYCPYFENIKEFWAQKDHPNILFLFYEEMYKDLQGTMRRVANFLGKNYSQVHYNKLYEHLQFNNMKKNKLINFDEYLGDESDQVVRKGIAGGWRSEFDEEMTREADTWITTNLQDVNLKFPLS